MPIAVALRFRPCAMPCYFDPRGLELEPGDVCVVEHDGHTLCGEVVAMEFLSDEHYGARKLPQIQRRATAQEARSWHALQQRQQQAMVFCKEKSKQHQLGMKISDVCIDRSNRKVTYHFTADKRVDFRALVRELAAHFKSRIELWQIGVRAETKRLDGFGVCGLRLCCANFLSHCTSITLRMAKEQDLYISPSKISGLCGRLMCCLSFEHPVYLELSRDAPPLGAMVKTKSIEGEIVDRNLLMQTFIIKDAQEKTHQVKRAEILEVSLPEDIEKKQVELRQLAIEEGREELPPDDAEAESL